MHHYAVSRATRESIAPLADRSAGLRGGGLPVSTVNVGSWPRSCENHTAWAPSRRSLKGPRCLQSGVDRTAADLTA